MASSSTVEVGDDLGAYQSLNSYAVLSLVLGMLSVLAFAWWLFLWILPPAALICGMIALRRIADAPEVWAGRKIAMAGVVLALVFGGLALSRDQWVNWNRRAYARAAAGRFIDKIQIGDMESAFWLTMPKAARTEMGTKSLEEMDTGIMERYATFRSEASPLAEAAANGDARFEFDRVEGTGTDRGLEYVLIVYKVHTPGGDRRLLLETVGGYSQLSNETVWWVRNHKFDYEPGTFEVVKPGGHDHSH